MLKRLMCSILLIALLLPGCGAKDADKANTEPTQQVVIPYPYADTFNVINDSLSKGEQIVVRGTDCSTLGDGTLSERFEKAERTDGVFPHYNQINLIFEGEVPTLIRWNTDDGFNCFNEGVVAADANGKAVVDMGYNRGAPLSSDLYYIPTRKLRLVFEYADRSVEYLMVMEDTTRFEERETIYVGDWENFPIAP